MLFRSLDKASRILIPGTLRDYANLSKKIIMSGQGRNFELWDESTWNKQLANLDALSKKEVIPIEISQLSLCQAIIQSVMFDESIEGLNVKNNGIYIDATFGRGGHTRGILDQLNQSGKVIAFDQDIGAVDYAKEIGRASCRERVFAVV